MRGKTKAESRKPSHLSGNTFNIQLCHTTFPFQNLGVDKRATLEVIKKAKAREFHPDKHANASKEEQVSVFECD